MSLLAVLTVKVSAILFLALIGVRGLRRRSAAARHWLLAVGVVSACAAPVFHVAPIPPAARVAAVGPLVFDAVRPRACAPCAEPADAGGPGPAAAAEPAVSRTRRAAAAVGAVARDGDVGRVVVTIWLVGAAASAGVLLAGLARLRRIRASSRRVTDGPWPGRCAELARSCGLERGVDLRFGPLPGLAATWGWRRPVVMLPAAASRWSAERMRVVLLHELAHARRGDWLLQMAAEALRCVWWFNPLAWTVRARLRRESEHAADDFVLARGVPATTCAAHLVELAREVRKQGRTRLPAPAMARPSHLERRLSTMLNRHTNRRPMTRRARFRSLAVLAPISVLVASLQVADAVEQEPASERVVELVARAAALQDELQTVLDELQTVLDGPGRRDGRPNEPIRVGNGIPPPAKVHDVPPVYPAAARAAGVQGVVILEATVDPAGAVSGIEVLRSVPELDEAAIAAVEQWRYEPTLVNGAPVPVLMTVTIAFRAPASGE